MLVFTGLKREINVELFELREKRHCVYDVIKFIITIPIRMFTFCIDMKVFAFKCSSTFIITETKQ